MNRVRAALLGVLVAWFGSAAGAERVSFPSHDGAGRAPVMLVGYFFAAATASAPTPAIAMFHGCGGAYDDRGAMARRMREYAALFNGLGLHVLVVDSLTPRYEKELCTQPIGKRRVTPVHRRLDALGAIDYLAGRADVDAARIGLIGWSHGGSAVLGAINLRHRDVATASPKPAFAIAFYPGCDNELKRGWVPSTPLLLLVGAADDWTPGAPCMALAASAPEPRPEIVVYPDAGHGFDSDLPVRLRKDVPNGLHPGQGAHVRGNPAARRASRDRIVRFLGEH
ncbi:MAG: dienelactone hydrolase family protein [Caldimonas sp.]